MMKNKVLASILVVCVVFGAGAALAQNVNRNERNQQPMPTGFHQMHRPDNHEQEGQGPNRQHRDDRPDFEKNYCMHGARGPLFTPDMPKEIRAKAVELAKLRIDLEEAMFDKPINKAKAIEIHAQIQKIEAEIEAWRFAKKLDMIEKVQKNQESRKNTPPAPRTPQEKNNVEAE